MATVNVRFNDPNPPADVDAYWVNLYDALDSLVKANTFASPINPSTPARSLAFIATLPAALPIKVTVQAVKNGQAGPIATYIAPAAPSSAVTDITVTVA